MPELVNLIGPMFDGRAIHQMDVITKAVEERVAHAALEQVQRNLDQSIRHPTPYYETRIAVFRHNDHMVVWDQGVIYGPWLEGTSRRNMTTRFKGYSSFRRATQTVQGKVTELAEPVVLSLLGPLE
jgi:hypothetical protein